MTDMPSQASGPRDGQCGASIDTMPVQRLLEQTAERFPEHDALEFHGRRFTYRQFLQLVNRAAKGLQAMGVGPGVRVGLYLPNTPHFAVGFFAILKAGGTVVNVSPLDAEHVIRHKINDSQTRIILTLNLKTLYPMVEGMLGSSCLERLIVGNLEEVSLSISDLDEYLQETRQLADVAWGAQCISFRELITNDGNCLPAHPADLGNEVAVLQYTGGTTGLSKGAMLTHANLSSACGQALQSLGGAGGLEEGVERMLVVLPLFHIYALTFNLLLGVRLGALLMLRPRFDVARVVHELAEKKVTVFFGVPTMFTAINALPGVDGYDLSSIKIANSGGAPLPAEVHQRFEQLTGCRLQEGWGMTETCGVGTSTPRHEPPRPGACGVPMPQVKLRFARVDDPAREAPAGTRGEVCIAGPNVMKGYWNNPDATAEAMSVDGYLRTGDVGYRDEDGLLWIVDRIKDMTLCSGYNVYPRNIEEAIYQHPAVEEVLVIGITDAYRGQSPKAFVRLKPGEAALTLAQMQEFLRPYLGKHEMIHALEFRESLPKTAVGKLSRKELYDEESAKARETPAQNR